MRKKQWDKASPRAKQKAVAQKDLVAKIVKARLLERALDRELAERLAREP